ncbi:hypothetical protein DITRI_Ditri20bG0090600 [Diplodiscus trichospermus]
MDLVMQKKLYPRSDLCASSLLYDYIIIGGGTAGCALAATLATGDANVIVLERGGSPYVNTTKIRIENFISTLVDTSPYSFSQAFISEDGVPNYRARVLGGGTVINAGFYSRAETFFLKQTGLDEALANDSYRWVEKKLVYKPVVLQWQSAVRNGLLEAGVLTDDGFTYDHIIGTKTGGTILDRNGNRHTAADLLEYANPRRIKVYLHAVVQRIIFTTTKGRSRPKAKGVIFYDASGRKHITFLKNDPRSEIISTAGATGSPQLLLLSGIGPAIELQRLGIKVVLDQPMVGQEMADNTLNGLIIPSPQPIGLSLGTIVGITKLADKVRGPISKGYLELENTNINDNPKVRFNYFQAQEDLRKCAKGMKIVIDVLNSKSFSRFRYRKTTIQDLLQLMVNMQVNFRPKHPNSTTSLEQYCIDTVMTFWHYHGGCLVGKFVDRDYKVLGVDSLRVIDGSTLSFSPGTNPQATVMMLGRYMGRRILQSRRR